MLYNAYSLYVFVIIVGQYQQRRVVQQNIINLLKYKRYRVFAADVQLLRNLPSFLRRDAWGLFVFDRPTAASAAQFREICRRVLGRSLSTPRHVGRSDNQAGSWSSPIGRR